MPTAAHPDDRLQQHHGRSSHPTDTEGPESVATAAHQHMQMTVMSSILAGLLNPHSTDTEALSLSGPSYRLGSHALLRYALVCYRHLSFHEPTCMLSTLHSALRRYAGRCCTGSIPSLRRDLARVKFILLVNAKLAVMQASFST